MEITININAPELAAAIQSLADAIVAAGCIPVHIPEKAAQDTRSNEELVKMIALQDVSNTDTPEASPQVEPAAAISLEEVRALFVSKNSIGNRDRLKNLLKEFKVKKVTDLQEKDFADVVARLEAL